ncbi:hypothetical protein ACQP3L_38285, partial [Escherichia coli]
AGKIESGVVFNIKTLTELFCSHGINNPTITLDSIGNGLSLKCFRVECDLGVAFFPFFTIQMSEFDGWSERFSSIKSQWEII